MMTSERPKVSPDGLYPVTEVCKILHISRKTLSRYREGHKIKSVARFTDNRILFRGSDIINLWMAK